MKLMKKNFLITGRPGIGKTTCVKRIIDEISSKGFKVGGIISLEERVGGKRIGFKLIDVLTGEEGWLARTDLTYGPRVGRYRVCIQDLERIGVGGISRAISSAELIVIDEIGPMELYSTSFKESVVKAFNSSKPVVATIHIRAKSGPFGRNILGREDSEIFILTFQNREIIPKIISRKILKLLDTIDTS